MMKKEELSQTHMKIAKILCIRRHGVITLVAGVSSAAQTAVSVRSVIVTKSAAAASRVTAEAANFAAVDPRYQIKS